MKRTGLIGLGDMGMGMARNLLAAGFHRWIHRRAEAGMTNAGAGFLPERSCGPEEFAGGRGAGHARLTAAAAIMAMNGRADHGPAAGRGSAKACWRAWRCRAGDGHRLRARRPSALVRARDARKVMRRCWRAGPWHHDRRPWASCAFAPAIEIARLTGATCWSTGGHRSRRRGRHADDDGGRRQRGILLAAGHLRAERMTSAEEAGGPMVTRQRGASRPRLGVFLMVMNGQQIMDLLQGEKAWHGAGRDGHHHGDHRAARERPASD